MRRRWPRFLLLPLAVWAATVRPLAAAEAAAGFPDRTGSFDGVAFGAGLDGARERWQLEEVEGVAAPGDPVEIFLREEESHVLGGVVAREVVYYFLGGRFYAVGLATPDNRQTTILREALELGYGAPPHAGEDGCSLVWPGSKVSAQLQVNPSTGEGRLLLFSNELQPEFEQSLREAARKTAEGF
jgi:hypothetical protein